MRDIGFRIDENNDNMYIIESVEEIFDRFKFIYVECLSFKVEKKIKI